MDSEESMINFFTRHRFLKSFNEHMPHMWQPNCTDVYHPPFVYFLAAYYGFKNILEIGQAEGYGSYYLAVAAMENGGTFLAIDIQDTWERPHEPFGYSLKRYFEGEMLPARFIQADTKLMGSIPNHADGGLDVIDLAYIDGEHKTETILHEVYDLILPKTRGGGWSYICLDDVVDQGAQDAWSVLKKDPRFECLGFHPNGGFGIARVM